MSRVRLSPYSRRYARPKPIAVPCRIGDSEAAGFCGLFVSFAPHNWPDAFGCPAPLGE